MSHRSNAFQPETDHAKVVSANYVGHPLLENGDRKLPDDEVDKYADRDTQCGVGSCRPRVARPLGSIWVFTAVMSVGMVVANMNYTYYSAVITQIERRFGMSSAMTGFIKNVDNIGFMSTVLVASHFGRHANKPRLLAASTFLSGIAIFLFAVPHFMYGGPATSPDLFTSAGSGGVNQLVNGTTWNETTPTGTKSGGSQFDMCSYDVGHKPGGAEKADGGGSCDGAKGQSSTGFQMIDYYNGALILFIMSELLQGMAISPKTTLSMTYMDDNAKDKSAQHFGIMFAMRAFAPMLGFLMGAWTNTIYVDLSKPDIDPKDPRWIGAWWIGFVICSVCTCMWAIPFALFPKRFAGTEEDVPEDKGEEGTSVMNKLKDMPKSVWRIVTNPVYVCCLLGTGFNVTLMGFSTFLPKYYQSYFGVTPAMASFYTGIVSAVSWGVGTIISGPIVSRLKATVNKSLLLVVGIHCVSLIGYASVMFIDCPQADWVGTLNHEDGFNGAMSCNANCTCNSGAYSPICGSDGRNYFSPCYAGCRDETRSAWDKQSKKVFTDCACIADGEGTATMGMCQRSCTLLPLYITVIFFTFFVTSMMMVPLMTVKMRCVDKKDKAMALAVSAFVMQIASFPAPIFYGRVIDSVCIVKQQRSCNRKGACLLYDHDSFRWQLHILPLVAKICATCMYLLAWFIARKRFPSSAAAAAAAAGNHIAQVDESDGNEMKLAIAGNNKDEVTNKLMKKWPSDEVSYF